MTGTAELSDLYLTLRAVNAPLLSAFTQSATAGEDMVAALNASFGELDARIAATAEGLAALRGEMATVGATGLTAGAEAATASVGAEAATASAGAVAAVDTGALTAGTGAATAAADETAAAYDRVLAEMKLVSSEAAKVQAETDAVIAGQAKAAQGLAANMAAASSKVNAANADLATAEKQADSTGKTFGLLGLAGAAAAVAVVKGAADFETATTRLQTSAGETDQTIGIVRQGILDMAGQVGFSANQLANAMYTVSSSGIHGADGLIVLKAAAQGAKAEQADLTTVTDAVTTVLQDYHLGADQAANVTSKLVTAVGDGKTTFQEFASSLHSVTPLAANLHVSLADVTGALASMTVHGMSADQASQNLADVLRHMAAPTNTMTQELAQLGINSQDLNDKLSQKGLTGTLQDISQTILQKMGPSGKVLLDAFNQSKVAAQGAAQALSEMPPKLQDLAKAYADGHMTLNDFRQTLKGLPADQANILNQWATMQNRAQGFSSIIKGGGSDVQNFTQALYKATGDATGLNVALMLTGENTGYVQKAVKDVSKASADASGNVKGWTDVQKTFNQKASEAKDALSALGTKVGTDLLPPLTSLIGKLADGANWLTQHKGVADALAGTLGVVLAGGALTAAGSIAKLAWNVTTGPIKAFAKAGKGVWDFASDVAGGLKGAEDAAGTFGGKVGGLLKGAGQVAGDAAKAVASGGKAMAAVMVETVWPALVSAATATWSFTVALLANPITWIIIGLIALGVAVYELIKHWSTVEKFFKDLWHNVLGFFDDAFKWVQNALSNAGSWLYNHGKAILEGFLNGLKAAWQHVTDFIGGIGSWIASHKGPIEVDRELLRPHGAAIMGGFLDSIRAQMPALQQVLSDVARTVSDTSMPGLSIGGSAVGFSASAVPASPQLVAAASSGSAAPVTVVNLGGITVHGSVSTENDLIKSVQKGILQLSGRNPGFATSVAFA